MPKKHPKPVPFECPTCKCRAKLTITTHTTVEEWAKENKVKKKDGFYRVPCWEHWKK